jgi:hypothetical protein
MNANGTKKFPIPPEVLEQVRQLHETDLGNDFWAGIFAGGEKYGSWTEAQWRAVSKHLGIPMPTAPAPQAFKAVRGPPGATPGIRERSYLAGQALMGLVTQKLDPVDAAARAVSYADAVMSLLYPPAPLPGGVLRVPAPRSQERRPVMRPEWPSKNCRMCTTWSPTPAKYNNRCWHQSWPTEEHAKTILSRSHEEQVHVHVAGFAKQGFTGEEYERWSEHLATEDMEKAAIVLYGWAGAA